MNPNELLDTLEQIGSKYMGLINRGSNKGTPVSL
jgi:hypothetical protein